LGKYVNSEISFDEKKEEREEKRISFRQRSIIHRDPPLQVLK
jgi:hypothetical protein